MILIVSEENLRKVLKVTTRLYKGLMPNTNKYLAGETFLMYSRKVLSLLGLEITENQLAKGEYDMAINEKAERDKMLDYVSSRMNKAADKMIDASNKVKAAQDDETRKVWLKKYVKHRMSYMWYKKLLEDALRSIDDTVNQELGIISIKKEKTDAEG